MDRPVTVEMVVVAYRSRRQVTDLLAGLPDDLPLVVVDNSDGSDGLADVVARRPASRYLPGGGVGFGRAASLGATSSAAEVVLFVNPDVRPTEDHLLGLVADVVLDETCSASAAVVVEADGRLQLGAGGWEPTVGRALVHSLGLHKLVPRAGLFARPEPAEPIDVDWVSGPCMAVRRETFIRLGCFDPAYFVYNEDIAFGRVSREHGLHELLRTDVLVPGDSGGSGAPSLEMMRLRGASMNRYVARTQGRRAALSITAAYAFGYALRAGVALVTNDRPRARERWAQVIGALTGRATVGGRVVT